MNLSAPQYFFDDALIAAQQRLVRRWFPATLYPDPVLTSDRPWEFRNLILFGTIIPLPDNRFRLYYCDWQPGELKPGTPSSKLLVAESDDGLKWEKPDLNRVAYRGSTHHNISHIFQSADSPSIVYDPADSQAPFKMVFFEHFSPTDWWADGGGLQLYVSSDGLDWTRHPGSPILKAGDRTNLMAGRCRGRYVLFTRQRDMFARTGGRAVSKSESDDFRHWTEPELMLAPTLEDEPDIEFYGASVFERHGWLIALIEYWDSRRDLLTTRIAFSRDWQNWIRPLAQPFIPPTEKWNRAWSSCASNGPIEVGDQMLFYFGGRMTSHSYDAAQQYGAIGYASLAQDRFCALEATSGGHFVTPVLNWPGGDLTVNADTRESFESHPALVNGRLEVEILTPDGQPRPDWSGAHRAVFSGNTHCRGRIHPGRVRWPNAQSLDALKGQPLRLKFHLVHARLFTIQAERGPRHLSG